MSTLLKYAGNKQNLMSQINPVLGDWDGVNRYVEPFAGALGSALHAEVPSGIKVLLSDANLEIIEFYQAVRENPEEVEHLANSLPVGEDGYYLVRSWDRDPLWREKFSLCERAARTIYLNRNCFNGLYRINNKGFFTTPWNRNENIKKISITSNDSFLELLNRAQISHASWKEVVKGTGDGDVVYCDPPYVDLKNPEKDFGGYIGSFGLSVQRELRDELVQANNRGARVVISNSWCNETCQLYREWQVKEIFATRRLARNPSARGKTSEILAWLEPPSYLARSNQ